MNTIALPYGLRITEAAAFVVAHAPARADYFGTIIRAKYRTTRPADVEAQYQRAIVASGHAYGARLPASQRARMKCHECGATGCKMWRESNTFADHTQIVCGPCAMADERKAGTFDAHGKWEGKYGPSDQIGRFLPAVPTDDGTFWGYTSVPADGCQWWRALPSYPARTA